MNEISCHKINGMEEVIKMIQETHKSFYQDAGFWISLIVGLVSAVFSFIAYSEAKRAKEAAKEAGRIVKIQTITIELTEIIQRLDKLDFDISYQDARDFYSEINRKVRRILSPYKKDEDFRDDIIGILNCLDKIQSSLEGVKPYHKTEDDAVTDLTVYYAIESEFSKLSGKLAELTGIFEQKNITS